MLKRFKYLLELHRPARLRAAIESRRKTRCPVMLVWAALLTLSANLQAAFIQGRVEDADTGKPLSGANVQIEGTDRGASSNRDGWFVVPNAPVGDWNLTASFIGYQPGSKLVSVTPGDTVSVSFLLSQTSVALDAVVVTATRTLQLLKDVPVATEVVDRREIRERASFTAADALTSEIGLDVTEDFAGQGVTLQGVDPDKVLILVDGNRVIGRVNGSLDLDQISASSIRQIEVVKGAVSTLYGSEAIGGVINVLTESADHPFDLSADLSGGGYTPNSGKSSRNQAGSVSLGVRRDRLGVRGTVRASREGLVDIDPSTAHTEGTDATDRINADIRADYRLSQPVTLAFTGGFMSEAKQWIEDSGLKSLDISYDDRESNQSYRSALELICTPKSQHRYSFKAYHTDNQHRWEKLTRPDRGEGKVKDYSESGEDFTELSLLTTRPITSQHLLTIGGDFQLWGISAESKLGNVSPSVYSSDLSAWDGFVQDEWSPTPSWTFLPGVRFEQHEIYGANWSPRLSMMKKLPNDVKMRGSLGFGYRAPTSKELYYVFNHASAGYIVYGNESLRPERSHNLSLSLEHTYKNTSVARLSFFFNDLSDLIDFDSIGVSEDYYLGIYQYRNISSAWTGGVEIERGFRMGKSWQGKTAYTYMLTRNRSTETELLHRPRHSARWELAFKPNPWVVRVWGRYTARMLFSSIWTTDDLYSNEWTEPFVLWNIAASRPLKWGFDAYVKAENLFDRTHARYGPRRGRVLTLGVRWNYTGGEE